MISRECIDHLAVFINLSCIHKWQRISTKTVDIIFEWLFSSLFVGYVKMFLTGRYLNMRIFMRDEKK